MLPHIVISAFNQSRIVTTYSPEHICLVCHVDPSKARRVRRPVAGSPVHSPPHIRGAHGLRIGLSETPASEKVVQCFFSPRLRVRRFGDDRRRL
jgi:hypothetical protein